MFRPNSSCDQGAQNRFDQVLVENAGEATRWLSVDPHEQLNVVIHPAARQTASIVPITNASVTAVSSPSTQNPFSTITNEFIEAADAQTVPVQADIILEHKLGGANATVTQVRAWNLTAPAPNAVSEIVGQLGRGFYRLRANSLVGTAMLQIEKLPIAEVS